MNGPKSRIRMGNEVSNSFVTKEVLGQGDAQFNFSGSIKLGMTKVGLLKKVTA